MMPFITTEIRPLASACGCALASVTRPCVAQRVWPMPAVAVDVLPAAALRSSARLPTARTVVKPASSISTMPAES